MTNAEWFTLHREKCPLKDDDGLDKLKTAIQRLHDMRHEVRLQRQVELQELLEASTKCL